MDGLVHLGSRRAINPLRELMHAHRPTNVYAAIALWGIHPDAEALAVLCHSVEHRPWLGLRNERAYAAGTLRYIDRREAVAALITAMDDRDIAVRANAKLAVKEQLRLNAEADARDSGHMTRSEFRAFAWAALDQHYPAN
jgi:HEAT repeat protein